MSDLKLVIAGAAGRMGQAIIRQAVKLQGLKIIAGLEANDHPAQGRDLGLLAGIEPIGAIVQADALTTLASADAVIDFTTPAVSLELADLSAQARIIHVIGTTGIDATGDARIKAAARHATIIKSSWNSPPVHWGQASTSRYSSSIIA
jgi:4-hydroxy-tetrahydrodipicolinate reductase